MRIARPVTSLVVVALLAAACGTGGPGASSSATTSPGSSGGPSVLPVLVSAELGVGPNRAVFALVDSAGNVQVADPERTVEVGFSGPGGASVPSVPFEFIWAIENERAVYAAPVDFPAAGDWTAELTTGAPGKPTERIRFQFQVKEDTSVLRAGDPAPSVDTPTAEDVGGDLSKLSTDDEPDPDFYTTSIADALAAGKPFVVAFATPKFCATAQCGPTLDRLKPVAADHPDVTFINVEPYELQDVDGQLQPVLDAQNQLQAVPAVREFGLRTEPYIFVVGADGVITASFEAVFSESEIDAALKALG